MLEILAINAGSTTTESLRRDEEGRLEHDAEKWVPVFGKHHAPTIR
jgi:hypothetical protein